MAGDEEENLTTSDKIERSVARSVFSWLVVLAALGVIVAWVALKGWVRLEPGESAVVLFLGQMQRTIEEPGLHLLLPAPLEYATPVSVKKVRHIEFGVPPKDGEEIPGGLAMQTADSNIVMLSYELQYTVQDPFAFLYGMKNPRATLADATQAAVREVVARKTFDEVLSKDRAGIESESRAILQSILESYFEEIGYGSPFKISSVQLQDVQPPKQVLEAFADVEAAKQDEARSVSLAQGDAQEVLESAGAKAREVREGALAYKETKVLEARGEAQRFEALLEEYLRAPEVTRSRLYIEAMEGVLPRVQKLIVEPDSVNMVPVLPLATGGFPAPVMVQPPQHSDPPEGSQAGEGS